MPYIGVILTVYQLTNALIFVFYLIHLPSDSEECDQKMAICYKQWW